MDTLLFETKIHGLPDFPYMVYRGILPEYLTNYPVHWHREMEIIYIVSGRGIITVQANQYIAQTGDMVLIAPEMLHSIQQLNNETMDYFNILFDFRLLEDSTSRCCEKYLKGIANHTKTVPIHIHRQDELAVLLTPHLDYLVEHRREKFDTDELMVKSCLYAILHHVNRFCTSSGDFVLHLEQSSAKIKRVIDYVQHHYAENITVEQAAALINYSANYFSRLFHTLTGTSFIRYVKDYRLEVAAHLLRSTEKTITEIAEETGFCHLPYFSRSFQQRFGLSPLQYRKS